VSALLGLVLGTGVLLIVSVRLWQRGSGTPRRRSALGARWRERLAHAGLERVTPGALAVVSVVLGVAVASAVLALIGAVPIALAAGIAVTLLPAALVSGRARRRRRASRTAWPDLLDHLVSGVRAGISLPDALAALPGAAFTQFGDEYSASGNLAAALDALKERLADPVADRVVETLRVAREVGGGELAPILRALGSALREESAMRSELEARQGWVVNAARLGVAAPWVVLALLATRPEAVASYSTPAGAVVIGGGLVVSVIAYRVMIRIGRLAEERRWFG